MINNRKVRLMTQLAIYERKEGKEDIELSKYYQSDYARFGVLRTAIAVTFSYVFLVMMVAFYKLEYLIDNALTLDYKAIGWTILGIYIGIMAFYLVFAMLGYSFKYRASRKKLGKYYRMLRKLNEMYREEDGYSAAEDDGEEREL